MFSSRYAYELSSHHVEYGVVVDVVDLRIDPQAQRSLNEKRAQKIAEGFVPSAVGSIVVSQRDDGYRYVVDGMHRVRASELNGITTMVADVHYGLTQQDEATLFLIKNRESRKPNPLDEYRIGLTAGLPLFVDINKVLEAHGLSMGSVSTNTIGAVQAVQGLTDEHGPDTLYRVLTVAELAWGRAAATWDGVLLAGLGLFLGRHGDQVSDEDLARKLAKVGPAQAWIGRVHSMTAGSGGTGGRKTTCYALIQQAWNKGKTKTRIV